MHHIDITRSKCNGNGLWGNRNQPMALPFHSCSRRGAVKVGSCDRLRWSLHSTSDCSTLNPLLPEAVDKHPGKQHYPDFSPPWCLLQLWLSFTTLTPRLPCRRSWPAAAPPTTAALVCYSDWVGSFGRRQQGTLNASSREQQKRVSASG